MPRCRPACDDAGPTSADAFHLGAPGRPGLPGHACRLPSAGDTAPLSVAVNTQMAVRENLSMVSMGHILAPANPIIATPSMLTLDMARTEALHARPTPRRAEIPGRRARAEAEIAAMASKAGRTGTPFFPGATTCRNGTVDFAAVQHYVFRMDGWSDPDIRTSPAAGE